MKSSHAGLLCLLSSAVALVSSAADSFVWDGTSAAYGGKVFVTYRDGQVAQLTANLPKGETVTFTGSEAATFAADGKITVIGLGALNFENPVTTLGRLDLEGDATNVTFGAGSSMSSGQSVSLDGIRDYDVEDVCVESCQIGYRGGGKDQIIAGTRYFERRENDAYSIQIQNNNGASTRCVKLGMRKEGGELLVKVLYCRQITDATGEYKGRDFDAYDDGSVDAPGIYPTNLTVKILQVAGKRVVKFGGALTSGGAFRVAQGADAVATGTALGAKANATCSQDVVFDRGVFTFLDCGKFTYSGKTSGSYGDLVFESSDASVPVATDVSCSVSLTGEDQVVLENTSIASLTGMTAVVRWVPYDKSSGAEPMNAAYQGALRPAFIKNIGTETVMRFQALASRAMTYSGGIRFAQVGKDIVAKKVLCHDIWHANEPLSVDPWTWDVVNDYANGPVDQTRFLNRLKDVSRVTFSSVTLKLAGASGSLDDVTDVTLAGEDTTSSVFYDFRPGANRRMIATVTTKTSRPSKWGGFVVGNGAVLSLDAADATDDDAGLWAGTGGGATATVLPGGRMVTNRACQNGKDLTVVLDGAHYQFRDATDDELTGVASYFFKRDALWYRVLHDTLGDITYRNGTVTDGRNVIIANPGRSQTIHVEGAAPSLARHGFLVNGGNSNGSKTTLTLDVADVTGGDEVDFTMEKSVARCYGDRLHFQVIKDGAGTVLMKAAHMTPNYKYVLRGGTALLGCNDGLDCPGVSFEGGTLASEANLTQSKNGTATLTEDSGIRLAAGSILRFADSSAETWASGKTLRITADPTASVYFGTTAGGLTRQQLRCVRLNGGRCLLDENGKIVPGQFGTVLVVR